MIIDMHTHIFPEKIAASSLAYMVNLLKAKLGKDAITPYTDGTMKGLLASMKRAGVDISVALPVVTAPKQFASINRFACMVNETPGLISFGGIHPDNEDPEALLLQIKEMGLRGIKLHPDYQNCFVDDPRMVRIIKACVELDLMVSIHAGFDPGLPDPIHCPPDRAVHMLDLVYGDTVPDHLHIILAHVGAQSMPEQVLAHLIGKPVYLDLSYAVGAMPEELFLKIVRGHGVDRALFASDSPWDDPAKRIAYLKSLPFSKEELEMIFWKNAAGFLPI